MSGGEHHSFGTSKWGGANGPRPPFTPGNMAAVKSGARSPRVYGELSELLAAGLVEDRPDLAAYPEAVAAWATTEAQAALMRRHIDSVGPVDEHGQPRDSVLSWLTKLEASALKQRATLGLDPRSEAKLARERAAASALAVDLTALADRGRAALQAREEAGLPAPPDLAGRVLEGKTSEYAAERAALTAEVYGTTAGRGEVSEPADSGEVGNATRTEQ